MVSWLHQTETYLDALMARVHDAKDAGTLASIEQDIEEHVLRHL